MIIVIIILIIVKWMMKMILILMVVFNSTSSFRNTFIAYTSSLYGSFKGRTRKTFPKLPYNR